MASEPTVQRRSARSLIWERRRASFLTHWRTFLQHRQGRIGLIVLGFFILIAIVGPFLVPASAIDPATAPSPPLSPPSLAYPLGTDNCGRSCSP